MDVMNNSSKRLRGVGRMDDRDEGEEIKTRGQVMLGSLDGETRWTVGEKGQRREWERGSVKKDKDGERTSR